MAASKHATTSGYHPASLWDAQKHRRIQLDDNLDGRLDGTDEAAQPSIA